MMSPRDTARTVKLRYPFLPRPTAKYPVNNISAGNKSIAEKATAENSIIYGPTHRKYVMPKINTITSASFFLCIVFLLLFFSFRSPPAILSPWDSPPISFCCFLWYEKSGNIATTFRLHPRNYWLHRQFFSFFPYDGSPRP